MNKVVKHDDSNLIWFDYNNLDIESLKNIKVSHFDIFNMPVEFSHRNIIGDPVFEPKSFELDGYFVSFFQDYLSKTGYSCMCINKDKAFYKTNAGYINGKPNSIEY